MKTDGRSTPSTPEVTHGQQADLARPGAEDDAPRTDRPAEVIALGNGLELRRRRPAHAAALNAAILANLDHLRPWVPWAHQAPTLAETTANCEHAVAQWETDTGYSYVIQPSGDPDTVVGGCGLHARVGAGALEIGYWVARQLTGQGVATTLARSLTEEALTLPGISRAEIHVDEANAASSAVPRKLGYRLERVRERTPESPAQSGRVEVWVLGAPAPAGPTGRGFPAAAAESLGLFGV
ncbi:GNAT family N-acetyltransferase [Streptacidiphilus sp. MAP5-3]|uniref:GNAT family N-acetyltransferase n=1 Tax=unclassified Streptacidiphilus TaxID=2643834 RepID=UPI003518B0C8